MTRERGVKRCSLDGCPDEATKQGRFTIRGVFVVVFCCSRHDLTDIEHRLIGDEARNARPAYSR
jgi:hypothetical protein